MNIELPPPAQGSAKCMVPCSSLCSSFHRWTNSLLIFLLEAMGCLLSLSYATAFVAPDLFSSCTCSLCTTSLIFWISSKTSLPVFLLCFRRGRSIYIHPSTALHSCLVCPSFCLWDIRPKSNYITSS